MTFNHWYNTSSSKCSALWAQDPKKIKSLLYYSSTSMKRMGLTGLFIREIEASVEARGLDPMWLDYVKQHLGVNDDNQTN